MIEREERGEREPSNFIRGISEIRNERNAANQHDAPFRQIRERICELGEEYGIRVRFKSERGTSKRCSLCGEKHKNGRMHRGLYHCKTHSILMNADVNGAYNILYGRKVAAVSGSRPMAWPTLLKWNTQEWELSAA